MVEVFTSSVAKDKVFFLVQRAILRNFYSTQCSSPDEASDSTVAIGDCLIDTVTPPLQTTVYTTIEALYYNFWRFADLADDEERGSRYRVSSSADRLASLANAPLLLPLLLRRSSFTPSEEPPALLSLVGGDAAPVSIVGL